jgi:hypothetical protein
LHKSLYHGDKLCTYETFGPGHASEIIWAKSDRIKTALDRYVNFNLITQEQYLVDMLI